ncbi:MAG TPA: oxygen-independent coproporphyrinogen III oxidase [Acetobacteraceae bacterium]|nr:oxygen-independent coproporphyrinogen III oxidase [Acetobacteraceae bacterium]
MDMHADDTAALPAALRYATQNLPRYTSYPTAPHFGPLSEDAYRGWLGQVGAADSLSLYVHVPFCESLCWYCGCHTSVTRSAARTDRYAAGLVAEAALLADALPKHGGVSALHFGGGTPSAIGAAALGRVMAALRDRFGFRADAELSVELDPRVLDDAILHMLAEQGFNRASLGVQDVTPEVQEAIGRIQPRDMVERAVAGLRRAGIASVNLDLMYGLPGQTAAHAAESARFAVDLGADRVAVFGYAHVPWMKSHQKAIREDALPGAQDRLRQAEAAERVLTTAGYVTVGLDHFARPDDAMAVALREGRLRRNFQGYTTDGAPALLGLGASAIGALPAGYAQNNPDERGWLRAVEAGHLPVARGRALTAEDRTRRAIIETLMCDGVLDLRQVPPPVWESAQTRLRPLMQDGLARLEPERLVVTELGRRFVRHLAAAFDAYLGAGIARHSRAV